MSLRMLTAACLAAGLSACGGVSRHCVGEFDYQKAETLPPPGNVEGLALKDSASALRIPAAPENPVPFARETTDADNPDKKRIECLDVPPRLEIAPEPEPVEGSGSTS